MDKEPSYELAWSNGFQYGWNQALKWSEEAPKLRGYEDGVGKALSLNKISFCRSCKCFGKDGKPFCTKFDFFDESMLDGKGFCYWGERV